MPHSSGIATPHAPALGQSETRLRQLFDLNLAGIFRITWDGIVRECNVAFARMFGFDGPSDLIGRSILPFYRLPAERGRLLRALSAGSVFEARELSMRRADGTPVWVMATAMRVSGEGGSREIEGTVLDVTSARQANEALLQSEARFRSVVLTAGSPIVCTELEQRITEFNPAAEAIFGLSRAQALGMMYPALFPKALQPKIQTDLRRVAGGSAIADFENVIEGPDGRVTVVLWNIQPLREADGRPCGIVAVGQDITGRQRAEESLLRQARYLRALTATDRAILALQSPEDVAEAVLRRMDALLPCLGATVVAFDHEAGEARVLASVGDTEGEGSRTRPLVAGELQMKSHTTSPARRGSRLLRVPLVVQGHAIGMLLVHQADDGGRVTSSEIELAGQIADRLAVALHNWHLYEREGEARRRLEAVSGRLVDVQERERRMLARELHDEIGQTLTSLKLQLELASTLLEPASLERATAVATQLIGQVRDLSLDLRPAILDDLGLLPALLWHVERYGRMTGVRVRFEHDALEVRFAHAIETAAYRIVQEALTNVARHATIREAHVAVRAGGGRLTIEVEDYGTGFDRDHQLRQPSTGLSGMRERATLLGGTFHVFSAPGRGTRVVAVLPVRAESEHDGGAAS